MNIIDWMVADAVRNIIHHLEQVYGTGLGRAVRPRRQRRLLRPPPGARGLSFDHTKRIHFSRSFGLQAARDGAGFLTRSGPARGVLPRR